MSSNAKWNVDQYKTEHESEEHWELRRNFMVAHKDKFPEERLVCLAQVFTNIEFLGCRYPAETMQLVNQLSEGVADEYREKQKSKLQRTFVKASDAAGAKVKGLKRPAADAAGPSETPPKIPKCVDSSLPRNTISPSDCKLIDSSSSTNISSNIHDKPLDSKLSDNSSKLSNRIQKCNFVQATDIFETSPIVEKTDQLDNNQVNGSEEKTVNNFAPEDNVVRHVVSVTKSNRRRVRKGIEPENNQNIEAICAGKFGRLVLLEEPNETNWGNILSRSSGGCQIPLRYEYEENKLKSFCRVFVNNHLLTTSTGSSRKNARDTAIKEAYEKLKQICYVLKIKSKVFSDGNVVDKEQTTNASLQTTSEGNSLDKPLNENIGSKLMRSMGWTGGGLGKDEQGIQEPVGLSQQVKRSGLGLPLNANTKGGKNIFYKKALAMLQKYANKDTIYDLVFSSEFTKEERASMHKIAQSLRLKSKSYGKDNNRSLVISKKNDVCKIVENMLLSGQYSTPRYELIKPPITLPPDTQIQLDEHDSSKKCETSSVPSELSNFKTEYSGESASLTKTEQPLKVAKESHETTSYQRFENKNIAMTPGVFSTQEKNSASHLRVIDGNVNAGPFGRLVLVEDENCFTPIQIIERSANGCHVPFRYEYANVRGGMVCKLFINNILVTSATDVSKKRARKITVSNGIEKLKDVCYTLTTVTKMGDNSLSIMKTLKLPRNKGNSELGSDSEKCIFCVSKNVNRASLGMDDCTNGVSPFVFKNKIHDFLRDYLNESCPFDLIIPPDFTSPERLFIQKTASGLALKTNLYEVSKKDFLVLSKKLSILETAEAILRSGGNVSADSFETRNMDAI